MSQTFTLPVSVVDQLHQSHDRRQARLNQRPSQSRLVPPFNLPKIPSGSVMTADSIPTHQNHAHKNHSHSSSSQAELRAHTSTHAHTHDLDDIHLREKRSFEARNTPAAMPHRHLHLSKPTAALLRATERYSLLHSILADQQSRRIFYFMLLNLAFMGVQSTYGYLTGSLGLISDSIHMFFDCVALLVGVCATVMSKWPPSSKFPYGYGKLDTLAGLGNGIFLMLISVEIVYEAIERLFVGSEVQRTTELLVVSLAGLIVNLVGIFAFHGHHGHHHGHDHNHSHTHEDHNHEHEHSHHSGNERRPSNAASASPTRKQRSEGNGHHHHHGGENMQGIYLHIMADALGSVAVVVSTLLVRLTGWSGFDPLASCIIAVLIFASTVPLVLTTTKILLLSLNSDIEYNLRDILGDISSIRGVVGYTAPKFWLEDIKKDDDHSHHTHDHKHDMHDHDHHSDEKRNADSSCHASDPTILGTIHIQINQSASLAEVQRLVSAYFATRKMDVIVQYEREGDNKCWCSATSNGYTKIPQTGAMKSPINGSFSNVFGSIGMSFLDSDHQQQDPVKRKKGNGGAGSPLVKML